MPQMFRTAIITAALLCSAPADAQPIVIGADEGAVFDGILDGFPGIAALDGTPDFGGNAIGVALKTNSTEERAIGEFPLAVLEGVAAGDIASATLVFNIDDALTTFGPGTEFTGFACEEILVHLYAGDGAIQVTDFLAVDRTAHLVDTRPLGPINDTSLRTSGPLTFAVDVTEDLRALLTDGTAAIGVVWRTGDAPTGTSIDDLGDGALGPPGVNGSFMPFLSIELESSEPTPTQTQPPTPTSTPPANTPTATPEAPTVPARTATSTATSDPNATPTATRPPGACAGDCDDSGAVTINELITGVRMAIGETADCAAVDTNDDGTVGIAELITAVGALLGGC